MGVKVKCRRCGEEADVDDMSLDPDFRMVVCSRCIKSKNKPKKPLPSEETKAVKQAPQEKHSAEKPKVVKTTPEQPVVLTPIAGTNKLMYHCVKCNYPIKYDPDKRSPNVCPYCGEPIKLDKPGRK